MIFFPPGKNIIFFPEKVLLIFLCEPKTIFFFPFSYFLPFSPLYPFLLLFFLRLLIIIFPNPSKANIFAPPRGANRKINTPASVRPLYLLPSVDRSTGTLFFHLKTIRVDRRATRLQIDILKKKRKEVLELNTFLFNNHSY